jgi:hypothetical protein
MQPVEVSGQISGDKIIAEVLRRIREKLEASNSLRAVDSYQGYSFVAEVQLQLQDVDRVEVAASVKAGIIDPSAKVQRVTLQDDVAAEGDESWKNRSWKRPASRPASSMSGHATPAAGSGEVSSRAVSRK